ncbi:dolichyl-phosphate-mannose-mannosyltransferase family protein [Bacillus pseudomycoides]|nr:dolichyl-phosphate-mannose-mannosyltransferase family protein [Bacillus pseudomycoides]AJI17764.1 dolichyl-phosphate-mannose-mannosyltransferase family protein [Bacillus pseudomycoides]
MLFLQKGNKMKQILRIWAVILFTSAICIRFFYASPFAATWDEVDFTLALKQYDILAMQPHFPGYPFFILGGMITHLFIENPVQSLGIFNAIMALSAAFPMYWIARHYVSRTSALIVVAVLQTSGYFSILVTQPMSEGAALAIVWWYIWSIERAFRTKRFQTQFWPVLFFALLMGIRLSYAPFGIVLILLLWQQWHEEKWRFIILFCTTVLSQLVWVSALIWNIGGITGLWKISFGFVEGHFTEWGGAVTETSEPLISRFCRLLSENIIFAGIGMHSYYLVGFFLSFLFLFVLQWKNIRCYPKVIIALGSFYFLWNLLGQNIDKPRHSYPIVAMFLCVFAISWLKRHRGIVLLLFATSQLIVSIPLMKEQQVEVPATYQLASYLEGKQQSFIVYTWEETRVMEYLQMPYEHKRFYTYDYFLQDKKYHKNDTIYVTNHLIEGFEKQGIDIKGQMEQVAVFRSNPLFDPVYHKIVLYRWKK